MVLLVNNIFKTEYKVCSSLLWSVLRTSYFKKEFANDDILAAYIGVCIKLFSLSTKWLCFKWGVC